MRPLNHWPISNVSSATFHLIRRTHREGPRRNSTPVEASRARRKCRRQGGRLRGALGVSVEARSVSPGAMTGPLAAHFHRTFWIRSAWDRTGRGEAVWRGVVCCEALASHGQATIALADRDSVVRNDRGLSWLRIGLEWVWVGRRRRLFLSVETYL